MTEATVEVPPDEIATFQSLLTWRCVDVAHGFDVADGSKALSMVRAAHETLGKTRSLLEQGEAANEGECATYRGDPATLLDACHAMVGEYGPLVAIHDDPSPWDFEKAVKNIDPLARWVRAGRQVQKVLESEEDAD